MGNQTALLLGSRLVGTGMIFLAGVITARLYEPALRGEYAMLTTIAAFVMVLANLGVGEGLIHFFNRGESGLDRSAAIVWGATGVSAIAACGAGWLIVPALSGTYFPTSGSHGAALGFAAGVFAVLHRNAYSLLVARRSFVWAAVSGVVQPTLFVIALTAVMFSAPPLEIVAIAFVSSWSIAAIATAAPTLGQIDWRSVDQTFARRFVRFSSRSYLNVVFTQMNYRLDILVVGYLVQDLGILAFYHIAASITSLLWLIPDSLGQAIFPRLSAESDESSRAGLTIIALRHVVFLVSLAAIAVGLASVFVVPLLFGEEYSPSIVAIWLLLPGVLGIAIVKILMRFMMSIERHELSLAWSVVGTIICVVGDWLLVPQFGVVGAALASTVAYLATAVGMITMFIILTRPRLSSLGRFPLGELEYYWPLMRDAYGRAMRTLRSDRGAGGGAKK